jgi:hypothetical protein
MTVMTVHLSNWADACIFSKMDKSFAEIGSVELEFPNARILLCHFHVIKYLQEKIQETTFGRSVRTAKDKRALMELRLNLKQNIRELVYAKSEADYEKARNYMALLIPADDENVFMEYFMKNWDSKRAMWAAFERAEIPHLRNNTNNRIESSWRHLKPELDSNMPIDEAVTQIVNCQVEKENEFDAKHEVRFILASTSCRR